MTIVCCFLAGRAASSSPSMPAAPRDRRRVRLAVGESSRARKGFAVAGAAPRRGWAGAARGGAAGAGAAGGGDAAARNSGFVVTSCGGAATAAPRRRAGGGAGSAAGASSGEPSMTMTSRGAGVASAGSSGMTRRRLRDRAFAVDGWASVAAAAPRRGWAGAGAAAAGGGDATARSSGFAVASTGAAPRRGWAGAGRAAGGAGVFSGAAGGVPPTARRRLRAAGAGGLVRDDRAVAPLRGRDDS